MNTQTSPIPAHKLPPPSGTNPLYLEYLMQNAAEQMLKVHGEDGRLPYACYIEEAKQCWFRALKVKGIEANEVPVYSYTIPTEGMEKFEPLYPHFWHEARLTTFYRDKGQLHWPHGEGVATSTVYLVQRVDGLFRVVLGGAESSMQTLLEPYIDTNIKADVIECQVPFEETAFIMEQPLLFMGQRHPHHGKRVAALGMVLSNLKGVY